MLSPAVQAWHTQLDRDPALQRQVRSLRSPVELLALAQAQGIELTGADLQAIAQAAFQEWVVQLSGPIRAFFETAQAVPELNQRVKQCLSLQQAIALAEESGFSLTEADLHQAAKVAGTIRGFSFERLWFQGLGML